MRKLIYKVTCLSISSLFGPDSSSLLDSHRVMFPERSGGGNSASEHILHHQTLKTQSIMHGFTLTSIMSKQVSPIKPVTTD